MRALADCLNTLFAATAFLVIAVGAVLLAGGPHFTRPFGWDRWYHAVAIFAIQCAAIPVLYGLGRLVDRIADATLENPTALGPRQARRNTHYGSTRS